MTQVLKDAEVWDCVLGVLNSNWSLGGSDLGVPPRRRSQLPQCAAVAAGQVEQVVWVRLGLHWGEKMERQLLSVLGLGKTGRGRPDKHVCSCKPDGCDEEPVGPCMHAPWAPLLLWALHCAPLCLAAR